MNKIYILGICMGGGGDMRNLLEKKGSGCILKAGSTKVHLVVSTFLTKAAKSWGNQ